jgi:hypothetical protein
MIGHTLAVTSLAIDTHASGGRLWSCSADGVRVWAKREDLKDPTASINKTDGGDSTTASAASKAAGTTGSRLEFWKQLNTPQPDGTPGKTDIDSVLLDKKEGGHEGAVSCLTAVDQTVWYVCVCCCVVVLCSFLWLWAAFKFKSCHADWLWALRSGPAAKTATSAFGRRPTSICWRASKRTLRPSPICTLPGGRCTRRVRSSKS